MKTLYLDCGMGAAGDMLTAALLELTEDPDAVLRKLNALNLPGVRITREPSVKCGITGTHVRVTIDGEEEESLDVHGGGSSAHSHVHNSMAGISHVVCDHLNLPEEVKQDVLAVYREIAEAESTVHGIPVTDIHFHEVGTLDAVADISAVCLLMHEINPDEVVVSPIHVGSGQVRCAHGILPVPAPATAHILKGIPICGGQIRGELCTPTGAALVKHFAHRFGPMPLMIPDAVGYGMGSKDFEAANCVRAVLGHSDDPQDEVWELSCNVDDMTPEAIGFALERLFENGALDAFTIPIGMKKCRPGTLIRVICAPEKKDALVSVLLRHTSTLGVRETAARRCTLRRTFTDVETPFGTVRRKDAFGCGVHRSKYEYEDLASIARQNNLSLDEVLQKIQESE